MTVTGIDQPESGVPVPPAGKPNVFQRIAGVLFAPAETFDDIARRPDVVMPMLFLIIVSFITTAFIIPRLDFSNVIAQQAEVMKKKQPNMSDDDLERVGRITRSMGTVMGWLAPVLQIGIFAIVAGVLLLAFNAFGARVTYGQAFSVTLYSWIPRVIQGVILTIVALVQGTVDPTTMATVVKSNPAFLVEMSEHPVLFSLLASLDVFAIWGMILLIFGFAAAAKTTKARAAGIVIPLWLLLLLGKVGFAAMGAARMKG